MLKVHTCMPKKYKFITVSFITFFRLYFRWMIKSNVTAGLKQNKCSEWLNQINFAVLLQNDIMCVEPEILEQL
jgi:hypothetical protein